MSQVSEFSSEISQLSPDEKFRAAEKTVISFTSEFLAGIEIATSDISDLEDSSQPGSKIINSQSSDSSPLEPYVVSFLASPDDFCSPSVFRKPSKLEKVHTSASELCSKSLKFPHKRKIQQNNGSVMETKANLHSSTLNEKFHLISLVVGQVHYSDYKLVLVVDQHGSCGIFKTPQDFSNLHDRCEIILKNISVICSRPASRYEDIFPIFPHLKAEYESDKINEKRLYFLTSPTEVVNVSAELPSFHVWKCPDIKDPTLIRYSQHLSHIIYCSKLQLCISNLSTASHYVATRVVALRVTSKATTATIFVSPHCVVTLKLLIEMAVGGPFYINNVGVSNQKSLQLNRFSYLSQASNDVNVCNCLFNSEFQDLANFRNPCVQHSVIGSVHYISGIIRWIDSISFAANVTEMGIEEKSISRDYKTLRIGLILDEPNEIAGPEVILEMLWNSLLNENSNTISPNTLIGRRVVNIESVLVDYSKSWSSNKIISVLYQSVSVSVK